MKLLHVIPLGILLTGCANIGPMFQAPRIDVPDRYSVMVPVQTPTRDDVQWWSNFNDPVLDQLITEGMQQNLSIKEAQARLRESAANLRGASGAIWTGTGQVDGRFPNQGSESLDATLSGDINLAGEGRRRVESAKSRLEAAQLNGVEAQRQVLSELSSAYVDLRFFQSIRQTREQDIVSRQRTLRDIQTQLSSGEATRLDELRAKSLLTETRSEIPQINANITQQKNRIAALLGTTTGSMPIDLRYQGRQPLPRQVAEIGVPADLLRARPDVRSAERAYAAAVSDVAAAKAARYPRLQLSGLISTPLDGGSTNSTLVAGLILPVFNQPALAAEVDAADARVEQAYLQWRQAILRAIEEVENAQVQLSSSLAASAAARETVELNRESLDLSRQLVVSGGNITVLDVLERERSLSASRTSLARNRQDVANGYIALLTSLGRGHPLLADEPVVMQVDEDTVARAAMRE